MSPSTKNLRERIEEIVLTHGNKMGGDPESFEDPHTEAVEALHSLLSSELSLAVKGLRDDVVRHLNAPYHFKGHCGGCEIRDLFKEILGESS